MGKQQLREQGEGVKDRSQGVGTTDCCTTYRVDRGDKLAGTCAPNNQTLNATAGSPGLRFSFADGNGGVFDGNWILLVRRCLLVVPLTVSAVLNSIAVVQ